MKVLRPGLLGIVVACVLPVLVTCGTAHAQGLGWGAECGADPPDTLTRHRAILACEAALANPDMSRERRGGFYLGRGYEYMMLGDYDRAMKDYDRAISMVNGYVEAYEKRARLYEKLGQFPAADADLTQALIWMPHSPDYLNDRCWLRARWGKRFTAALQDCDAALQLRPSDAAVLDTRCYLDFRMADEKAAIADCDATLKADPKVASSLFVRGAAKRRSGDTQGGNADIAAAEALDPKIAETYAAYGVTP